jgi:hypothetical protein
MIDVIEKGIEIETEKGTEIEEDQGAVVVVGHMMINVEMGEDQGVIILDLQLVIVGIQEIVIGVQIIMEEVTAIELKINTVGKKQSILVIYHMIYVGLN